MAAWSHGRSLLVRPRNRPTVRAGCARRRHSPDGDLVEGVNISGTRRVILLCDPGKQDRPRRVAEAGVDLRPPKPPPAPCDVSMRNGEEMERQAGLPPQQR